MCRNMSIDPWATDLHTEYPKHISGECITTTPQTPMNYLKRITKELEQHFSVKHYNK